jgi:hypothetical protein
VGTRNCSCKCSSHKRPLKVIQKEEKVNKREGWMTSLPEERGPLGMLVEIVGCLT